MNKCPKCESPAPHLHPAVQCEGEVHLCSDPFHETETAINTPAKIEQMKALRAEFYS